MLQPVALLLSICAHIFLVFALGPGRSGQVGIVEKDNISASRMIVRLTMSSYAHTFATKSQVILPKAASIKDASDAASPSIKKPALDVSEKVPRIPVAGALASRYFKAQELTEKPRVLQDIPANLTLSWPNVAPQVLLLRLMISENGEIDQVKIEGSQLPEYAERMVSDTFSQIKFSPGKIGTAAVKSQMRIQVTLDDFVTNRVIDNKK